MRGAPPTSTAPSGIYVHVPFCASRCSYCDFPTVIGRDDRVDEYLAAVRHEILHFQSGLPRLADTVFIGGGTPSRLTPSQVEGLLRTIGRRFDLAPDAEVTLECNPENLTEDKLRGYVDAGVTRVSIGVQSLDDHALARAGRTHDSRTALRAIDRARALDRLEVNVDLIAGLPGEDLDRWPTRVARLAAGGIDHFSLYLLETDKHSMLARAVESGRVGLVEDDRLADLYLATVAILEADGLRQYEISNFARGGRVSRHNVKYWEDAWYAGFGLGAHAYFSGRRRANVESLGPYLRAAAAGRDPLKSADEWDPARRLEEVLFLGLRLVRGVDLRQVGLRYGVDLEQQTQAIWIRAAADGLLVREGPVVRLTPRGRLCSNQVFAELLGVFRAAAAPGSAPARVS